MPVYPTSLVLIRVDRRLHSRSTNSDCAGETAGKLNGIGQESHLLEVRMGNELRNSSGPGSQKRDVSGQTFDYCIR